jgi:hypothetical protein
MTTTTTTETDPSMGTFYGLRVPYKMWAALGLRVSASSNCEARVDGWGGSNGDRQEAYIFELCERAKADGFTDPTEIVRRAIVLYADDRPARAATDLAAAIRAAAHADHEALTSLASAIRSSETQTVVERIVSRLSERTQYAVRAQLKQRPL